MKKPWQTLDSKIVHQNSFWQVRRDRVIMPNGSKNFYHYLDQRPCVMVVPFFEHNTKIYLVRQWRYIIKQNSWEMPAGGVEKKETLVQAARRELEEETGFRAKKIIHIGRSFKAIGMTNQKFYFFIATDLRAGKKKLDSTESDMIMKPFSIKKVMAMISSGTITDAATIVAMYFFLLHLKQI